MRNLNADWMRDTLSTETFATHGTAMEHPELYDLVFGDYAADIEMYRVYGEKTKSILECGIGTGRVAIPLSRFGRKIVGVDASKPMLDRLEQRLAKEPDLRSMIEPVHADMRGFSLGRTFDLIICPFMTMNYLMTNRDLLECLAAIRQHLNPGGGRFVFELMTLATLPELTNNDGLSRKVFWRNDEHGRRNAEMSRTVRFDAASQVVEQDRHYRMFGPDETLIWEKCVTWRNRLIFLAEVEHLLQQSGLALEATFGDHEFGPYDRDSQFLIVESTMI